MVTPRQLRNLNKKLNIIMDEIQFLRYDMEDRLPHQPKRWLKFDECVPPESVCKDINSMMEGTHSYSGFLGKLAEYYGCEPMELLVDKTIDKKYSAVYRPNFKTAYTRKETTLRETVLHEWFHHLHNLNIVVVNEEEEEHYADLYVKLFMKRAER